MGFDQSLSFYLFARPSIVEGIARVFDIGGTFDSYNESISPKEADIRATLNDWVMVGRDMQIALNQYGKEA